MNASAQIGNRSGLDAHQQADYVALAPARARFASVLIDRILALESYRQQAMQSENALAAIKSIAALTHKIGGVAGTLGYDRVGDYANFVEHNITAALNRKIDPRRIFEMVADSLEALLNEMEALLEDEAPRA